ncbi:MAG: hypothetical protein HYZ50_00810 [Deltaproteobacteria bacterium]|nr:hypothetical protein [Deltaproteobacteria bacterium]
MAKQQAAQGTEDLMTAYSSFFFALPLAGLKWGLGIGEEKEATEAAWNGYDASVRLASASVDALYRNPLFSDLFGRTLNTVLRWQHIGNTVGGAVSTAAWKALGAPSAVEVQALSDQLRALEARLEQVAQKKDIQAILDHGRAVEARLSRVAPVPLHAAPREERVAA